MKKIILLAVLYFVAWLLCKGWPNQASNIVLVIATLTGSFLSIWFWDSGPVRKTKAKIKQFLLKASQ